MDNLCVLEINGVHFVMSAEDAMAAILALSKGIPIKKDWAAGTYHTVRLDEPRPRPTIQVLSPAEIAALHMD